LVGVGWLLHVGGRAFAAHMAVLGSLQMEPLFYTARCGV